MVIFWLEFDLFYLKIDQTLDSGSGAAHEQHNNLTDPQQ